MLRKDILQAFERGYTFGNLIGKGEYGKVYRAQHMNRIELACKYIMKKDCPKNFLNDFLPREIKILKKISHRYIINAHSILETDTSCFIFMRYAEKGDLLEYIKTNGCVKEEIANIWFGQLADAINYLHSLNIAHRDLKCDNILISKNFNLKIADFGFARQITVNDILDHKNLVELSETYCGSAAYAPPEVISGTPYNIMKADIWSLGIILLVMLNARMPLDDSNISRLIIQQRNRMYETKEEIMINISESCKFVIRNCLEPNPDFRWSSSDLLAAPWILQVQNF